MNSKLQWTIGKESSPGLTLDTPPFRAYFYWIENGELKRAADFSREELRVEIDSRKPDDEELIDLKAALARL